MKLTLVALSGHICSGKSTLADLLVERAGALKVKTNELLVGRLPSTKRNRQSMQRAGDQLDKQTDGGWVADGVRKVLEQTPETAHRIVIIDAVRIKSQLEALRKAFGYAAVIHVHLTAGDEELSRRYGVRHSGIEELPSYERARANRTEKEAGRLAAIADVVIETDRCVATDVFVRVAARLGLVVPRDEALVDVMVGGQYGSEGKGNIANYLAPEYDVLVRVGGPNAGHKVFRLDEKPFTFHQLPSGALANGQALLVLGAGAVISLERLMQELTALSVPVERLAIDGQAMIIEQEDIEWETRELKDEIASTAQGVGCATARKINGRKTKSDVRLAKDIAEIKHYVRDTVDVLAEAMYARKRILLEGTQGTSLSLHHGHYPYVTSRVTTAPGCLAEAGIAPHHVRRVVMVCRTYPIRVGDTDTGNTSGYMSKPISLEIIAERSHIPIDELRRVERTSTTNRDRRIAEFDWTQLRRSLNLNGATDIALTFADYLDVKNREAYRYEQLTDETLRFIEELEKVSAVPVSLISTAFGPRNIIDRRAW